MGNRGRETSIVCEKCKRTTRRDKAVFIDKVIFSNPIERKDIHDEQYTPRLTRTVAYCPSCGKHLRVYEKKKEQNQRAREKADRLPFMNGNRGGGSGGFRKVRYDDAPRSTGQSAPASTQSAEKPAEQASSSAEPTSQ